MTDAAIVLSIIAGKDPNDNFTLAQPPVVPDFTKALNKHALEGRRIGVPRRVFFNESINKYDPSVYVAFEQALEVMKTLGATVVDPADLPSAEEIVLDTDFKVWSIFFLSTLSISCWNLSSQVQINEHYAELLENPSGVRSLADLIAFNDANSALEKPKGFQDQSV